MKIFLTFLMVLSFFNTLNASEQTNLEDCKQLLYESETDFKSADDKWNSNSQTASYYSIRGQQYYLMFINCKMNKKFLEQEETLKEMKYVLQTIKNSSSTFNTSTDITGTGY